MDTEQKKNYEQKFSAFTRMCADAKSSDIGVVIVASRWVIGDTEEERQESLERLREAGLELIVADEKK
jgi:hypothetical protein